MIAKVDNIQLYAMLIARDVLIEKFVELLGGENMSKLWHEACEEIDQNILNGDFLEDFLVENGDDAVE